MGIKGLLRFLKGAQRDVHIDSFRGQTAAVDAYCWLHKGAYSCAKELVTKEKKLDDLPFLRYCMKKVNLLQTHDISLIVVFDGARLPMKAQTEKERRERRHEYLTKGKALLKAGKNSEAVECFQRCVDVSPQMALAFIRLLRAEGIQVIVAPYEADAQLTYLVKKGLAQFVITEDSDLLIFGCSQVLFKMDDTGHGKLIQLKDIGKGNKSLIGFTPDSFRHVGILCGCDYLPSIPGVGPSTATKLMRKFNRDPYKVIRSLKSGGKVPSNYEEEFRRADCTFLYQLVFDPISQTQVCLTTPSSDIDIKVLEEYTGLLSSPSKQVGLARGNINPLTLEQMDTYSPVKQGSSSGNNSSSVNKSMKRSQTWSGSVMSRSGSLPRQTTLPVSKRAKQDFKLSSKNVLLSQDDSGTEDELAKLYGDQSVIPTIATAVSGKSVSRNIFSKKSNDTGHAVTVVSKYFSSSNKAPSSLDTLDQFDEKNQSSCMNSEIDIGEENEEKDKEEHNHESKNEKKEENDKREGGKMDREVVSGNSTKRKLLDEQDRIDNKRHKPDNTNEKEDTEEQDSIYVTSSSKITPKINIPCRRIGLTKTSKKSSFTIPRPANEGGTLYSYFSYKPREKLQ